MVPAHETDGRASSVLTMHFVAAALFAAVWITPLGHVLLAAGVLVHEFGHLAAATLTGAAIRDAAIYANGLGYVHFHGGAPGIVLLAGYATSVVAGLLLYAASTTEAGARRSLGAWVALTTAYIWMAGDPVVMMALLTLDGAALALVLLPRRERTCLVAARLLALAVCLHPVADLLALAAGTAPGLVFSLTGFGWDAPVPPHDLALLLGLTGGGARGSAEPALATWTFAALASVVAVLACGFRAIVRAELASLREEHRVPEMPLLTPLDPPAYRVYVVR